MLLGRKRRSVPAIDEAEDGGRAIAIEEGISALVFSYAAEHDYLEGVEHVDHELPQAIKVMVSLLEVGDHRAADWEKAILEGFAAWRAVRAADGGFPPSGHGQPHAAGAHLRPSAARRKRPNPVPGPTEAAGSEGAAPAADAP